MSWWKKRETLEAEGARVNRNCEWSRRCIGRDGLVFAPERRPLFSQARRKEIKMRRAA